MKLLNCVWEKCDIFCVTERWEGGCDLKTPDMELPKEGTILKDPKPAKFCFAFPVRAQESSGAPAGPAGLGGEGELPQGLRRNQR